MKDESSTDSTQHVPSIPRYIIGIIVGVVSVLLGAFFLNRADLVEDLDFGAWSAPIDRHRFPYATGNSAFVVEVDHQHQSRHGPSRVHLKRQCRFGPYLCHRQMSVQHLCATPICQMPKLLPKRHALT